MSVTRGATGEIDFPSLEPEELISIAQEEKKPETKTEKKLKKKKKPTLKV